jgi:hypothetical protein
LRWHLAGAVIASRMLALRRALTGAENKRNPIRSNSLSYEKLTTNN